MSSLKPAGEPRKSFHSSAFAALRRFAHSGVRSRQEALDYLARRGCAPTQAAAWVRECQQLGLIDDRAAAQLWAGHWARRDYADSAIRSKLLAKGFHQAQIHESIAALQSDTDDDARARRFVASHLRHMPASPSLPAPRHRAGQAGRLASALASRGFDSELIERVLAAPFDADHSETE